MGTRVTVDSNFFGEKLLKLDFKTKEKLIKAFATKRLCFYPSLELIGELLSTSQSQNRQYLNQYASFFLSMEISRILKSWEDVMLYELGLNNDSNIFLAQSLGDEIKNIFDKLAYSKKLNTKEENFVAFCNSYIREGKNKHKKRNREVNILYNKGKEEGKFTISYSDFDEFYDKEGISFRKTIAEKVFKDNSIPIIENKIIKIIENPNRYPYFSTYSKINAALFYYYNIIDKKIERGDFYDHFYLTYFVGLEYIVSDERRMKEIAQYIFGNQRRVLTFDELIKLAKAE